VFGNVLRNALLAGDGLGYGGGDRIGDKRAYRHLAKRYGWKMVNDIHDPETGRNLILARVAAALQ
jgi:hypothetical protein